MSAPERQHDWCGFETIQNLLRERISVKRILFISRNLAACFDYNPIRNSNSIAIAHRSRRGNDLLSQLHALTTVSHCCYSGRNGGAGEPYHSVSSSQRMQLKNCKLISSPFFQRMKMYSRSMVLN